MKRLITTQGVVQQLGTDWLSSEQETEDLVSEPLEIDEITEMKKHDPDLCDNGENPVTTCETLSAQSKGFIAISPTEQNSYQTKGTCLELDNNADIISYDILNSTNKNLIVEMAKDICKENTNVKVHIVNEQDK